MPDLALIAQAVDFVEDNLKEPIGVADMAESVGYSLYHFCRTFNEATHHTPYGYLMRRRLSEAARVLLQTEDKIIDIAFDYRFNIPETFSRAFKRVFGTQPSQWRREGCPDPWRLMPRLTLAHLEQIAKGPYLRPALEELDACQIAGLMTLVRGGRAVIAELWALLGEELAAGANLVESGDYYGIARYGAGWEQRGFLYTAAVKTQGFDGTGTALAVQRLPALTCARFVHRGRGDELPLTLDYVLHTWLPKSGRRLARPWVIERYGPALPGPMDKETQIALLLPIET